MPDRQCVYNSVKTRDRKSAERRCGSSGSGSISVPPASLTRLPTSPASAAPSWGAPFAGAPGRLERREVLGRRSPVGMRQVGFAVPGASRGRRSIEGNLGQRHTARICFLQSASCFTRQLRRISISLRPCSPVAGSLETPLLSSHVQGSSGGCGSEEQMPPPSGALKRMTIRVGAFAPPSTVGALDSIPKEASERGPGSTGLAGLPRRQHTPGARTLGETTRSAKDRSQR